MLLSLDAQVPTGIAPENAGMGRGHRFLSQRTRRSLETKLLHDWKLANHVGQKLQQQVPPGVGCYGVKEGGADNLGSNTRFRIVGDGEGSGGGAARNPGIIEPILTVISAADDGLTHGKQTATEDTALGNPVIAGVLVKGRGKNPVGEDP